MSSSPNSTAPTTMSASWSSSLEMTLLLSRLSLWTYFLSRLRWPEFSRISFDRLSLFWSKPCWNLNYVGWEGVEKLMWRLTSLTTWMIADWGMWTVPLQWLSSLFLCTAPTIKRRRIAVISCRGGIADIFGGSLWFSRTRFSVAGRARDSVDCSTSLLKIKACTTPSYAFQ